MRSAYVVTLYHDSETDAAVDSDSQTPRPYRGGRRGRAEAIEHAQSLLTDYWQTATIELGYMEQTRIGEGVWRDEFVGFEGEGWYVGRTWLDAR
jgi:hypothetical protein